MGSRRSVTDALPNTIRLRYGAMMTEKRKPEQYDEAEARVRFEATLRGALKTPPQPKLSPKKPEASPRRRASSRASSASEETGRHGA